MHPQPNHHPTGPGRPALSRFRGHLSVPRRAAAWAAATFVAASWAGIAAPDAAAPSKGNDSTTPSAAGTATPIVVRGIELESYRSMVDDVRKHPEHGWLAFRAISESEDNVYHSTTRIGPFEAAGRELGANREYILHVGLPVELQPEVVKPVDRVEPVELALAGLSDCVIGTIRIQALMHGIDVERVTATVRAPLDTQVLLGLQGVEQRTEMYGPLSIDVALEGDSLTEADRRFLAEQAKRSPVFNLITLAHDAEPAVTLRQSTP